jgi:AraC-like DNA-binding protein
MAGEQRDETVGFTLSNSAKSQEQVSFHRRSELPGVELRSLKNCARTFHCFSTGFQFFAPITWQGELWHRRRQVVMAPGTVLCARPGEAFFSRRVIKPGTVNFLTIDASVFQQYLSDQPRQASAPRLRAFTKMSRLLEDKLQQISRVIQPGPSALEVQTATLEFIAVLASELLEDESVSAGSIEADLRVAERVRECLDFDASGTLDLATLARQAGVSRFQALRLFKLRYGLPPHTYQLSMRLALAQKALREGQQAVQVAAQYGFFDQSHLTRHFKRLFGVTPAHYARGGARARHAA